MVRHKSQLSFGRLLKAVEYLLLIQYSKTQTERTEKKLFERNGRQLINAICRTSWAQLGLRAIRTAQPL